MYCGGIFWIKYNMQASGTSSQSNEKYSTLTDNQKGQTSTNSNYNFQDSNQEKDKFSFLQKWLGNQRGEQDGNQQMNSKKRNGISWGEDIHYII